MKGCNLRCYWCHNPEAISHIPVIQFFEKKCIGCGECVRVCPHSSNGHTARNHKACELCGKCASVCYAEALILTGQKITTEELIKQIEKDREIFGRSGGGITFSGGETLLQPDFLLDVLCYCREQNISTAIESALNVPQEIVAKVAKKIDYFICDLKTVNPEKHRLGTGKGNDVILKNIMYLAKNHRDVLVRTPIIPEFNDTVDDMRDHAAYLSRLGEKVKVELLSFHGICEKKRGPSFVRSIAPNNGSCTAACRGGGRRYRRKAPTAHSGFETTRGDANDAETPDCGLQGHCQQRGWGRGGRVGKGRKGEIQPLRAVRTLGVRRDVQRRRPRVCRLCSVGEPAAFSSC